MWHDLVIYTPMYVTAFWAVVLLISPIKKNLPKHFLGLFMVVAFLVYFSHMLYFKQKFVAYLFMDPIYMFASLAVYPMYFWYIKLLTVETRINYKNLWLLFPSLIFAVATAVVYLLISETEKKEYLNLFLLERTAFSELSRWAAVQAAIFAGGRLIFSVQVVLILIYGRKLVIRYNQHIANFYSNLEDKTIVWVKYLLYSFVVTSVMSLTFNIIGRSVFIEHSIWLLLPSLIFSVLLFFIGLQGYMQNHTVQDLKRDEEQQPAKTKILNHEQLKINLLRLFSEEKIYKQSDLKITHVSLSLQTNRTYISNLINQEFNCSFSEFVNKFRINEAKFIMSDRTYYNYSLDHISEVAGFGSVSTFIRVFKEYEGITPGKFREAIANNLYTAETG